MIKRIREVLTEECGIAKEDQLVLGVSGGADSLALLDLLNVDGWNIVCAHFNHLLRDEAEGDVDFVRDFCQKRQIEFITGSANVRNWAASEKKNLELAARELRYKFLLETAEAHDAAAVLVAHHADDQIETVLMHLIRGTGLNGLTGMYSKKITNWHPTIPLVRPMLGIWREEILAYCAERGLQPRVDETNFDTGYVRNRLRHHVIPGLIDIEANVGKNVLRMTELVKADEALISSMVKDAWKQATNFIDDEQVMIDRKVFLDQSIGLQRRLIMEALRYMLGTPEDIDFGVIEKARKAVNNPPVSQQIDLSKNLRLIVQDEQIIVTGWETEIEIVNWPQIIERKEIEVNFSDKIELSNEKVIRFEQFDQREIRPDLIESNRDPNVAFLDAEACGDLMVLRGRKDGDRFQPLGMEGRSIKVSDLLINAKVPKLARARLPMVVNEDRILWIAGFPPAHFARITEGTKRLLKISIIENG